MFNVIIIGDQKFYYDSARTQTEMPFHVLRCLDDTREHIETVAHAEAPKGVTGMVDKDIVGDHAHARGGNVYTATAGLRKGDHTEFVHRGTGLWGPFHQIIRPARGNVFPIRKEGRIFFRRWIRGQRPQPFFREAVEEAERSYVPYRVHTLAREVVR